MPDQNPLLTGAPTWADAYDYNANALSNWVTQQRQISADRGLWNPQTGLPTAAGVVNAGQQYGNALLMGTTAPTGRSIDSVRQAWDALGVDHALSENNGTITLSKIIVPQDARNQGVGSQALQHLTDYADATGQRIVLTPSKDFGATNMARLADFYKDAGFRPNKGRSRDFTTMESMIRDPSTE